MSKPFSREQILHGLTLDIAESLAIDVEDVTPGAAFFSGLAGESIELLDISFRIQKRFGIRANFRELIEGWQFDPDGQLSASAEQQLSVAYPGIDWATRFAACRGQDPRDALTVDLIAELLFASQSADSTHEVAAQQEL